MKLFVVLAVLGSCSAFAPAAGVRPAVARSSALAVRQTAPVMELETVDTWCAAPAQWPERQHRRRPHALFASETQQSAEPPPTSRGTARPSTLHSHLVSKARPCLPYLSAHVAPTSRWGDKEYPDSVVLGIGKNVPSKFYGVTSGLALGIGLYCIAQSNLLNILSGSTVNGFYVFGALLVPYSWGLHVASWIQKQNGK